VPAGPERSSEPRAGRFRLDVHADEATFLAMLADDVRRGLGARPRALPPKYFYDAEGSLVHSYPDPAPVEGELPSKGCR